MNVIKFAVIMQEKLDENSHKTGWNLCSIKWLMNRLVQEKGELKRAIEKKLPPDEIDREAADVANFAMMIADNYREGGEMTQCGIHGSMEYVKQLEEQNAALRAEVKRLNTVLDWVIADCLNAGACNLCAEIERRRAGGG